MHVVERFAAFAEASRREPIAPEVLHHAKRAVIDWYAALLPGAVVPPATMLERAFAEELDRGEARLALGRRATVRAAALINGSAAHTVEVDDIFRDGIYHPGAPTIPAALALAQARRASGEAFLRAVIVGYEISTRIGAAMGRAHYKYWHNTGTIGCFGAAAAAAELLQLDPDPLRARARDRRHLLRRAAAGVPHGLDVEAAARRARRRGRRHRRARRGGGGHRLARRDGRRGRLRPRDGRRPGLGQGARHARARLPHHPHDVQEPRLLRPHVRGDRRRARGPVEARRRRARHRARPRRHLSRRARGGALRGSAARRRKAASRSSTSSPRRSRTAACGSRPSSRRGSPTRSPAS